MVLVSPPLHTEEGSLRGPTNVLVEHGSIKHLQGVLLWFWVCNLVSSWTEMDPGEEMAVTCHSKQIVRWLSWATSVNITNSRDKSSSLKVYSKIHESFLSTNHYIFGS